MNAERLSELARDALDRGDLTLAMELAERFLAQDPTDRPWGLSFMHTVLERLKADGGGPDVVDRLQAIQEELLANEPDDAPWVHRWERARQLNARAWGVVEACEDCSDLDQMRSRIDQALVDIDEALAFDPLAWPWTDTKVRLLLAAGRDDEAFACIRRCEAFEPQWPDFEQERASAAYRAWCRERPAPEPPAGRASPAEVLHVVPPELITRAGAHLCSHERAALRASRVGVTEADRAQNVALIGLRLEARLSPSALAAIKPWEIDLSRGLLQLEGAPRQLPDDLVGDLRHWVLYAANNHPAVHLPVGSPHPIRQQLFFDWLGGRPLSSGEVERRLAHCAAALGIVDAGDARWGRPWFSSLRSVRALDEAGRLKRRSVPSEERASVAAVASVHGWINSGEDTWILYSYEVDGVGYGFVYLTPYDELHRAFGDHPAEWYDELVGSFAVRFDPAAPERHRVCDARFVGLHGQVSFISAVSAPVGDPDDRR